MKFWYMDSQKPTRDERSWVIGMAETGFNINYDDFHFDIHKTIAYRIINRFVQTNLAWDRPRSGRQNKNWLTGGLFHSDHIKTGGIFTANPLCITFRNCLWYVSVHQNYPEPCPNHVENVQNIDILSFLKAFLWQALRSIQMKFFSIWYWLDCNRIYCEKYLIQFVLFQREFL